MNPRGSSTVMKTLALDLVWSVAYFPLWWYSAGLVLVLRWAGRMLGGVVRTTGVTVWFRNLFVPMFGQRDVVGRIISFVLRSVVIVWYAFVLVLTSVYALFVVALWLLAPVVIAAQLYAQTVALMSVTVL